MFFIPRLGYKVFLLLLISTYIMMEFKDLKKALLRLDREQLHLDFLSSCKDYGVIPKFLQTRSSFVSRHHANSKFNFEFKCLKRCIRSKHALVTSISKSIYGSKNSGLYQRFADCSVGGVFDHALSLIHEFREKQTQVITERHRNKLHALTNGLSSIDTQKTSGFVNLTNHTFTDKQLDLLNKGPKFILHSSIKPINYIPQMEDIVKKVEPSTRNNLRCNIFTAYSRHLKKDNIDARRDHHLVNSIKNIPGIMFIPTDKTNKIAAINETDYLRKMNDAIGSMNCTVVTHDPLPSIINKTLRMIKEFKTEEWSDQVKKTAKINNLGLIPKMIGVIKDHKLGMPLRPIVVKCQSPTFHLEKTLVLILRDLLPISPHVLKSSMDFVQRIDSIQLPTSFTMFSLDVVALYPSIDMSIASQYISNLLSSIQSLTAHMRNSIASAFNLIASTNFFRFHNRIYFQNTGAPMGSPISGIAAECIMRPLEEAFIESYPVKPLCWLRFVDDVFVIWTGTDEEFDAFLSDLNQFNSNIQFTMEKESNGTLPYLDVLLHKKQNYISRSVYRKMFNSNCTIPYDAYTPNSYKQAAYKSYIQRALKVCTSDTIEDEFNRIRSIAIQNGFPLYFINDLIQRISIRMQHPPPREISRRITVPISYINGFHERLNRLVSAHDIDVVAFSGSKLINTLKTNMDSTPINKLSGVYELPIEHQDGSKSFYIGQTSRKLEVRIKEHQNNIRKGKKNSAVARAVHQDPLLNVKFDDARIIAPFSTQARTIMRESIEIYKRRGEVVNDQDSYTIPAVWLSLL